MGCTFDGASVMMANSGGVTQQLQVKIGRPVIVSHCVAHRLELAVLDAVKAGSHVRRKHKHKEVHTSNANASTVQYASAIEYSKMVDEVHVLVLLFFLFLFLGLRRIRRRRLIQRNNKSRPKRLWVREIFRKRQLFPFLSQHLSF